jgi:hypothetical protein
MPSWASGPDRELGDPGGMFGPDGEVVGIESEFLLKILDDGGVFEEEHGASPARKLPLILASL